MKDPPIIDAMYSNFHEILTQMSQFITDHRSSWLLAIFSTVTILLASIVYTRSKVKKDSGERRRSLVNGTQKPRREEQPVTKFVARNNASSLQTPAGDRQSGEECTGKSVLKKVSSILGSLPDFEKSSLAAILLKKKSQRFSTEKDVICITTGSKVQSKSVYTWPDGKKKPQMMVQDISALSLARRSFIRFLQDEVEKLSQDPSGEDSVLTLKNDSKGYTLKKDLEVYLILNSLPTGYLEDQEVGLKENGSIDARESDRFKSSYQKLTFWSLAGIQGPILSNCLDPVYISHIVFVNCEQVDQFRASFESSYETLLAKLPKEGKPVKPNFDYQHYNLNQFNIEGSHVLVRNWICNSNHVEIIDVESGKNVEGRISRLCDAVLFDKFQQIKRHVRTLPSSKLDGNRTSSYTAVKGSATTYCKIKKYFELEWKKCS